MNFLWHVLLILSPFVLAHADDLADVCEDCKAVYDLAGSQASSEPFDGPSIATHVEHFWSALEGVRVEVPLGLAGIDARVWLGLVMAFNWMLVASLGWSSNMRDLQERYRPLDDVPLGAGWAWIMMNQFCTGIIFSDAILSGMEYLSDSQKLPFAPVEGSWAPWQRDASAVAFRYVAWAAYTLSRARMIPIELGHLPRDLRGGIWRAQTIFIPVTGFFGRQGYGVFLDKDFAAVTLLALYNSALTWL
jgi:hypothetical protein